MSWTSLALALLLTLAAAVVGPAPDAGGRESLLWWTTHALEKVRPSDPPGEGAAVELTAARNEFEPFQLVLRASGRPLREVDIELTDLVTEGGGERIESRHGTVYLERYVRLERKSSKEGGTGDWPDPLVPRTDRYAGERRNAFPFDLQPARNQPLWIELYVPPRTAPGDYRGEVRVSVGGRARLAVPVTLRVWSFTLPSTASLPTSFGFSGVSALRGHFGRYTDDDDLYRLTRLYAVAALRHRVSLHGGSQVPPPAQFRRGEAELDWADYDREVGPLLDGTLFGDGDPLPGARVTSIDLCTQPEMAAERKLLYWRAWSRHFRDKGWHDRLFVYLKDEPSGPGDYPEVRRLGLLARRADPELRTLLTEQFVPDLASEVDVWVTLVNCIEERPGIEPYCEETVPRHAYRAPLRRGGSLWWYQSCVSHGCQSADGGDAFTGWPSYVIDVDPVANRIMPWLAWSFGVDGELYYNTVEAYAQALDPWKEVYLFGGNGDGTLFYPGTPSRIGGTTHVPVESLRLKLIREGLEDYEYLALLARARGEEEARRRAEQLAPRTYRWQRSPEALYAARQALGRAIDAAVKRGRGEETS